MYHCQWRIAEKFSDLATSSTWLDCVRISRLKFEKYFLHKALRLLHHFPPETETNAGKFWAHPKKIPNAGVVFSATDELHLSFVRTMAQCLAFLWGIQVSITLLFPSSMTPGQNKLERFSLPSFSASNVCWQGQEILTEGEDSAQLTALY